MRRLSPGPLWRCLSLLIVAGVAGMAGAWLLAAPRGAPLPVEGDVVELGEGAVLLSPAPGTRGARRLLGPPLLVRQLRVGDRIRAELRPEDRHIGRLRFLRRAPPPPPPDDGSLPMGATLPARAVPGTFGPFPLGAGQGTPTVLAFFFTSCGIPTACPMLANRLGRLQEAIRGHGRIVALTLDPEIDTLPALRGYAAVHQAAPGTWLIGRLDLPELEALLRQVGVARARSGDQLLHGQHLTLLDGDGRLVWRSDGNSWEVDELSGRLRALPNNTRSGS